MTNDRSGDPTASGVQRRGAWTVVVPRAEVDPSTAPALRATLDELRRAGTVQVAVDWDSVIFFDSSAISVLIEAHFAFADAKGEFVVVRSDDHRGRRLFELMGLDQILTFTPSLSDLDLERHGPGQPEGATR